VRNTHELIIESDHITALGNDGYFSWTLIFEFDEWVVVSIYGQHHATCKTFKEALESIDYNKDKTQKEDIMKFSIDASRSVTFEFVYGSYTINVADYINAMGRPEGKISVLVQKHGENLSSKTVERLAAYINQRIEGVAIGGVTVIEISIQHDDQFMNYLLDSIRILLHG
jgi:hypothetical protein